MVKTDKTDDQLSAEGTVFAIEDGKRQMDGFQTHAIDDRSMSDILIDWQYQVAEEADAESFLAQLGLGEHITASEWQELQMGEKGLGRNLAHYLSQLAPNIPSTRFLSKAQYQRDQRLDRVIDIPADLLEAVPERQHQVARSNQGYEPNEIILGRSKRISQLMKEAHQPFAYISRPVEETVGSPFYTQLIEKLRAQYEQAKLRNPFLPAFDEARFVHNIAEAVGVDVWSLQGFMPLPRSFDVGEVAAEISNLIPAATKEEDVAFFALAKAHFEQMEEFDIAGAIQHGASKTTGRVLRLMRHNLGAFGSYLAKKLGGTEQSISVWENDVVLPLAANLVKLLNALEVPETYHAVMLQHLSAARERDASKWAEVFGGTQSPGTLLWHAQTLQGITWNEAGKRIAKLEGRAKPYTKIQTSQWIHNPHLFPRKQSTLKAIAAFCGYDEEATQRFIAKRWHAHDMHWQEKYEKAETLGSFLAAKRELLHLTQPHIGRLIEEESGQGEVNSGVFVYRIENSYSIPNPGLLRVYMDVLQLDEAERERALALAKSSQVKPKQLIGEIEVEEKPVDTNELAQRLEAYIAQESLLRPIQKTIMGGDVLDSIADGVRSGYIKRPTGTGKTVMYCSEAVAFNTPDGADKPAWDMPTMILVPRRLLANQTRDELVKRLGVDVSDIGILHTNAKKSEREDALKKPILITTYQSALTLLGTKGSGSPITYGDYPIVIADEMHQACGDKTAAMMRAIKKTSFLQGWTATDEILRRNAVTRISDILLDGEEPIHETTLEQAVRDGETVEVDSIVFNTQLEPKLSKSAGNNSSDFKKDDRLTIVNQKGRDKGAIKAFAEYQDSKTKACLRDMTSVWYCEGIKHAGRVAKELNRVFGKNYAAAISSDTPTKKQEEILKAYEKGEIRALVNADLLIEGWDSSHCQVCMMLRPTKSPRIAVQTAGRVMRLDDNNPDKKAYVITLCDKNVPRQAIFSADYGANLSPEEKRDRAKKSLEYRKGMYDGIESQGELPSHEPTIPPDYEEEVAHPVIPVLQQVTSYRRDGISILDRMHMGSSENFYSQTQIAQNSGIERTKLKRLFEKLRQAYADGHPDVITYKGLQIPLTALRMEASGAQRASEVIAVAAAYVPGILDLYKSREDTVEYPSKPEHYAYAYSFDCGENVTHERKRQMRIELEALYAAAQEADESSIDWNDVAFDVADMGYFSSQTSGSFAIDRKYEPQLKAYFAKLLPLPNRYPEAFMSANDVATAHGYIAKSNGHNTFKFAFRMVSEAYRNAMKHSPVPEYFEVEIFGKKHICAVGDVFEYQMTTKNTALAFNKGIADNVAQSAKRYIALPEKPEHMLLSTHPDVRAISPVYKKLADAYQFMQQHCNPIPHTLSIKECGIEITLPTSAVGFYKPQTSFAIDKTYINYLKEQLSRPFSPSDCEAFSSIEDTQQLLSAHHMEDGGQGISVESLVQQYEEFHNHALTVSVAATCSGKIYDNPKAICFYHDGRIFELPSQDWGEYHTATASQTDYKRAGLHIRDAEQFVQQLAEAVKLPEVPDNRVDIKALAADSGVAEEVLSPVLDKIEYEKNYALQQHAQQVNIARIINISEPTIPESLEFSYGTPKQKLSIPFDSVGAFGEGNFCVHQDISELIIALAHNEPAPEEYVVKKDDVSERTPKSKVMAENSGLEPMVISEALPMQRWGNG